MLSKFESQFALAARLLLALLFLPAGIGKLTGFAGTVGYIGSVGLPFPELGAVIAIVVEVGGALAIIAGFKTRWVALGLAVFTVITGLFFHKFWAVPADQVMVQQIMFFKNVAIAGGFLMLTAFGPGAWSVDAKRGE
jgi:putative oxidoreductase